MAITDKEQGVWGLEQVYNKINQGSIWSYSSDSDPGQLWAAGLGNNLGINQPTPSQRSSPVQIGTEGTWMQIDGGGYDSAGGIKSDGTLWTWGSNTFGKLGLNQSPSNARRSSPTQVGTNTTWVTFAAAEAVSYGIKTDGSLWGWGVEGQWGTPTGSPAGHRSSPTQVPGTWGAARGKIALWTNAAAAISSSGKLYTWCRNYSGSLGQNQTPSENYSDNGPTQVGTDTTWDTVGGVTDQGWRMAQALKTDGTMWAWGGNGDGQLGTNDTTSRSSPTQIGSDTTWTNKFACEGSKNNKLAIKTDGTLWAWGGQDEGQLGLNQAGTHYSSPTQVGTETTWSKIAAAGAYACFGKKTDGSLLGWGANWDGMMGQNNRTTYSSPIQLPGTWDVLEGQIALGGSALMMKKEF